MRQPPAPTETIEMITRTQRNQDNWWPKLKRQTIEWPRIFAKNHSVGERHQLLSIFGNCFMWWWWRLRWCKRWWTCIYTIVLICIITLEERNNWRRRWPGALDIDALACRLRLSRPFNVWMSAVSLSLATTNNFSTTAPRWLSFCRPKHITHVAARWLHTNQNE